MAFHYQEIREIFKYQVQEHSVQMLIMNIREQGLNLLEMHFQIL